MVGSRQLWQKSVSLKAKIQTAAKAPPKEDVCTLLPSPLKTGGFARFRCAACWQTDGSSNHSHIIILQGPALSQEEFPGITVQMVVCNEPSGVSGFNVSPQRDSYYCVCIMFVGRVFRTRSSAEDGRGCWRGCLWHFYNKLYMCVWLSAHHCFCGITNRLFFPFPPFHSLMLSSFFSYSNFFFFLWNWLSSWPRIDAESLDFVWRR